MTVSVSLSVEELVEAAKRLTPKERKPLARGLVKPPLRAFWAPRVALSVYVVVCVGFALAFLVLGFRWITLEPGSHSDFLWIGSYFGFSAFCMLGLALRLHSRSLFQSRQWEALPPLGNPKRTLNAAFHKPGDDGSAARIRGTGFAKDISLLRAEG
jgi:hypothetical protein